MSNRDLSELLENIRADLKSAKTSKDIEKTIDLAINYPGDIKYNNLNISSLIILSSALLLLVLYLKLPILTFWPVHSILLIVMMVGGYIIFRRNRSIKKLSDLAYKLDAKFDNKLKHKPVMIESLQKKFHVFRSGNDDQKILESFSFEDYPGLVYLEHSYKNKNLRVESKMTSEGAIKKKTLTETSSYVRYGIKAPFQGMARMIIKEEVPSFPLIKKASYTPEINGKKARIKAYGYSKGEASRILDKSLLTRINDFAKKYESVCIEFTGEEVFISSSTPILNYKKRDSGYEEPEKFRDEINGVTAFINLKDFFLLIKEIETHK